MRRSDGDGVMTRRSFLRGAMVVLGAGASTALAAACGRQAPAPAAQQGSGTASGPVVPTSTPRTVPPTAAPAPAAAAAPTQAAPAQTGAAAPPTAAPAAAAPAAAAKPGLVNNRVPLVREQDPGPPKRGGILETSLGKDPETLEVMQSVNGPLRITASLVYRRLVQFRGTDYYDIDVEPDMADSWTVSPDGKTMTFKLHQGIKWHNVPPVNGREFTSDDVAWTVNYYKTQAKDYAWLWDWVTKVETPDKYTVVFQADKPNAEALLNMAVDNNAILPREVFEADGNFRSKIIGTGPYIWKNWEPGVKVELVKNPDYWEVSELDGKPLPYLDGITGYIMPDYATRLAAYRSGKISGHRWGFQPARNDVDGLFKGMQGQQRWDGVHFLSGGGFILNVTKKPLDDVRVRRAMSLALNRDAIIKDVQQGAAQWGGFITASFTKFAWPEEKLKGLEFFQFNPDRARALLKDAGAENAEIQIDFHPDTSPASKVLVEMAQQMWKDVGLNAVIVPSDVPASYAKRQSGDFMLFGNGVGFSSASIDAATRQLYRTDGGRNYTRNSDPEFDKLADAQAVELDTQKRIQIVDQIQQYLYDQMWSIPHYDAIDTLLNQPWAKNWPFHWQLGWIHTERIWIDK
jgi:peptide/nickel transport system substrate-binding protein